MEYAFCILAVMAVVSIAFAISMVFVSKKEPRHDWKGKDSD